jgi:hypothetical protein
MPSSQLWIATEPGTEGRPNEDFVAAAQPALEHDGALVLLDGVTPPEGPPGTDGCRHGVPWFVGRLGGTLLERAAGHPGASLTECLIQAISRTAQAHRDICDLSHPRTPQATVVTVRWGAAGVEYLVLSDSALLLQAPDGAVRAVLDGSLDTARDAVRRHPVAERRERLEALRNAESGFHTAAADPAVAERAVTGELPRAQVRALAALTDGAGRWSEVFGLGGWPELFALLTERGPAALIAAVRTAERADPDGRLFPRGKPHDDAAAALLQL